MQRPRNHVGWRKRAPMRLYQRRKLAGKCFLMPQELKFPVCNKQGKLDCMGLRAAFSRARQTHREKVARKAIRMACKLGCRWTERRGRC